MKPRALCSWSTGKDSAFALAAARADYDVVGLITTVTRDYGRVSMHGVRETLLDAQAAALGLPCRKIEIPAPCPNDVYERELARALDDARTGGVEHVVFGDLFLEDLRAWRDARLADRGMRGVYPLWKRDTAALAREMIAAGVRATLTCIDPRRLDRSFAGREFDGALLDALPGGVDPCGENGEFHSFAWAGPMFARPIPIARGEVVERDGFVFADLAPC